MRIAFAIIFFTLWLLGMLGTYAIGAAGDLLLIFAVLLLVSELRRNDD